MKRCVYGKNYKILNPGGNKTALVLGNVEDKREREQINHIILKENIEVEQVGFLNLKENKLEMAGGEFCVNATRCAIWEYLKGKEGNIQMKVSGYKDMITGGITKQKDVYVYLPINKNISSIVIQKGIFHLVKLDGIVLAVVNEEDSKKYIEQLKQDLYQTKEKLKRIMQTFDTSEKAVGIILLEKQSQIMKIHPIIWVKTIDTVYYETACGSGSLAVAIDKNRLEGTFNLKIMQPSGYYIYVNLIKQGDILQKAKITGKVMEESYGC